MKKSKTKSNGQEYEVKSIYITRELLVALRKRMYEESLREGRTVSMSDIIRRAVQKELEVPR